jgi:iron complex transport system substrate-binding protein
MKKKILYVVVIVLIIITFGSSYALFAALNPTGSNHSEGLTVVDAAGRVVEIPQTPTRTIALQPGMAEILCSLGCGDTIVGKDFTAVHYTPEVWAVIGNLPDVGYMWEVNLEQIVALKPDIVFTLPLFPEVTQSIEEKGITIVTLDTKTLYDISKNIRQIGLIMDKTDEANQIATDLETQFSEIKALTENLSSHERPRVYFESSLQGEMVSVGQEAMQNQMISWAGGVNIYGDSAIRFPVVSAEYVLDKNPDVIILDALNTEEYGTTIETIKERPGWGNINAVKNDHIYVIEFYKYGWGPSVVDGVDAFAKWCHPNLFGV